MTKKEQIGLCLEEKTDGKTFKKWPKYPIIKLGKANLIILFVRKDKVQDIKIIQLKLQVHDTY